jgi:hypothetical protein
MVTAGWSLLTMTWRRLRPSVLQGGQTGSLGGEGYPWFVVYRAWPPELKATRRELALKKVSIHVHERKQ